jgi:predicted RNA-binding protein YlxR (DUF448 family)
VIALMHAHACMLIHHHPHHHHHHLLVGFYVNHQKGSGTFESTSRYPKVLHMQLQYVHNSNNTNYCGFPKLLIGERRTPKTGSIRRKLWTRRHALLHMLARHDRPRCRRRPWCRRRRRGVCGGDDAALAGVASEFFARLRRFHPGASADWFQSLGAITQNTRPGRGAYVRAHVCRCSEGGQRRHLVRLLLASKHDVFWQVTMNPAGNTPAPRTCAKVAAVLCRSL